MFRVDSWRCFISQRDEYLSAIEAPTDSFSKLFLIAQKPTNLSVNCNSRRTGKLIFNKSLARKKLLLQSVEKEAYLAIVSSKFCL